MEEKRTAARSYVVRAAGEYYIAGEIVYCTYSRVADSAGAKLKLSSASASKRVAARTQDVDGRGSGGGGDRIRVRGQSCAVRSSADDWSDPPRSTAATNALARQRDHNKCRYACARVPVAAT